MVQKNTKYCADKILNIVQKEILKIVQKKTKYCAEKI